MCEEHQNIFYIEARKRNMHIQWRKLVHEAFVSKLAHFFCGFFEARFCVFYYVVCLDTVLYKYPTSFIEFGFGVSRCHSLPWSHLPAPLILFLISMTTTTCQIPLQLRPGSKWACDSASLFTSSSGPGDAKELCVQCHTPRTLQGQSLRFAHFLGYLRSWVLGACCENPGSLAPKPVIKGFNISATN